MRDQHATVWRSAAAVAFISACSLAVHAAAGVQESLAQAAECMNKHEFEAAIDAYKQAQIDAPDPDGILYAIGNAWFAKGESLLSENAEKAKEPYAQAKEVFGRVADSSNATDPLRTEARFGQANCSARLAEIEAKPNEYLELQQKDTVPMDEFKKRVDTLRRANQELDRFVAAHPGHDRARRNAERLRYFWKRMLQEPPKPPPPVVILQTSTDYPKGTAQPLPEEASVQLQIGGPEAGS